MRMLIELLLICMWRNDKMAMYQPDRYHMQAEHNAHTTCEHCRKKVKKTVLRMVPINGVKKEVCARCAEDER